MKETNSKVLSQNEFEKARLDIMSNVLKNISSEKNIIEFDEILGEKLSVEINNLVDDYVNNLSQNKITDLANANLEILQSKSYFPNITEIYSVPYNTSLNGENIFENNVPLEIAKDITENDKKSKYYNEYFSEKDKVKFYINIRDLTSNTGEYLSKEVFSEKLYKSEKEKYDKFLLTECFKDLISDNILEKLNEKENNISKEEIENLIEDFTEKQNKLNNVDFVEKKSDKDFEKIQEKITDKDIEKNSNDEKMF